MPPTLAALLPIFALIALGWGCRRWHFPGDAFWQPLDRLVYYLLFPALLIRNFASADLGRYAVAGIGGATLGTMLTMALALLVLRRHLTADGPAFSSVLQGAVRFNTYAGLAIAQGAFGTAGLTAFSLVIAFVIPTANLISVAGLVRFAGQGRPGWGPLLLEVARNPLILSVLAGVALGATGLGLPAFARPLFDILAQATLPLALLAVGAGLDLATLPRTGGTVLLGTACRLLAMPALALGWAAALGLEGLERTMLLLYAALPVSPAAYVLARQLGGDHALMAAIITATTLVSALTLPLWLGLAG